MATSDGTISYNSQELHNLASGLDGNYKTITTEIDGIISEAQGLSTSGKWTGEMYDAFMTNINNYKTQNIDPLCEVIKDYIDKIENAANDTEAQTKAGVGRFS